MRNRGILGLFAVLGEDAREISWRSASGSSQLVMSSMGARRTASAWLAVATAGSMAAAGCTFDVDRFQFGGGGGAGPGGAGGAGTGGAGASGAGGQPVDTVLLADDQSRPYGIASDGAYVYWANFGDGANATGSLMRVAVDGGTPEELESGLFGPTEVGLDDANVYWITVGNTVANGGVYMRPKQGGATTALLEDYAQVYDLVVVPSPARVYFTCGLCDGTTQGQVAYIPVAGGAPTVIASDQGTPWAITAASGSLFWVNRDANQVMTSDLEGSSVSPVTEDASGPDGIAVAGSKVYWITSSGDRIDRMVVTGGEVEPVAEGASYGQGIAVDSANIYWFAGASLMRLPITLGEPTAYVSGQSFALGVTLDTEHVFWTDYNAGRVMQAPK